MASSRIRETAADGSAVQLKRFEQAEWQLHLARFCDANHQQNWPYAEVMAAHQGAVHEQVGIWQGDALIGMASVRIRSVPLTPLGLAYVPAGPLVNRGAEGDLDRFRTCIAALCEEYVSRRNLVFRVIAPIGDARWNEAAGKVLADLGLSPSRARREYRTMLINLQKPLDDVLMSFESRWRNYMRQAERLGIKVRWTTDPDEVDKFSKLHAKFMARKGFHAEPDSDFYAEVQRLGGEGSGIALALADLDGETIAGHLNSDLGDTSVYLLAYRDAADRRNNAAHLLNWAAIVRAHELGMKWYDLGGIDPQANPGGYRFKSGMRGLDVTAAGPMELAPGPIAHRLVQGLEAVQRARRKRH